VGSTADLQQITDNGNTTSNDIITSGDIQATSFNGGQLGGFRNVLINGSVSVQQRPEGTGTGFLIDRWYVGNSTPADWNSGIATFPGQKFDRYLRIGNGTGNNDVLRQSIELPAPWVGGKAGPFSMGSVWTFSFYWDKSSAAAAEPQFGFADTSSNANAVAQNPPAFTEVAGDTVDGWQRVKTTFTVNIAPNSTNICAYIQLAGNGTLATGFQLEPGPVATPFEHRPSGTELALCQRYFERFNFGSEKNACNMASNPNNRKQNRGLIPFHVQKRVLPTISGSGNGSWSVGWLGNSTDADSVTYTSESVHALSIQLFGSSDSPNHATLARVRNGQTAVIDANAEL